MEELEPEPGAGYDRLDSEDHRGSSGRQHRVPIAVAAATILAVTLAALAGSAWARNDERHRQSVLAQSALVASAVVAPRSDGDKPHGDVAFVTQRVDLAVVNGGPLPLSNVTVTWDTVHAAYSIGAEGEAAIQQLSPHSPEPLSLVLRNPCTAPAIRGADETPRLLVTATTSDGKRHKTTIDPVGIDPVWTAMAAACRGTDDTAFTRVHVVSDVAVGKRATRFTLRISNASSTDVFITKLTLSRGRNTSTGQHPSPLQVFPHFSDTLVTTMTITNCESAIEDISPTTIEYAVASADNPDRVRNVSAQDPTYSEAVGRLLYRACAKG